LATALLGSEQRRCTVASPEVEFLAALEEVDREKDHEAWVLLASAYAATYRRAGQTPPEIQPSQKVAPSPLETKRYCSERIATRLFTMVNEVRTLEPFFEEALIALAGKGLIVPPALLPDLLTWGRLSKQRRALLVPIVGERGQWLTLHNPQWKNTLQVAPADVAEQAEAAHRMSGQQALYEALDITDNIFSKTYSVFKGQGLSGNGRLIQLVVDKIVALSKPGEPYLPEQRLSQIAIAAPPGVLPELIRRIQEALVQGEDSWWSKLVKLMEYRLKTLEELANE
jgi:hypothetical protein